MRGRVSNTINYNFDSNLCSPEDKGNKHEDQKDIFYTRSGGLDYARIPLKKPYELTELKNDSVWRMNLHAMNLQSSISNITGVNIIDGVIVIHSANCFLRGTEVPEAWFVVIPEKRIEKGFDNEEEFTSYLTSINVKKGELHSPDNVNRSFIKKWPIDWTKDFN
jgi:hypothetical protein